MTPKIRPLRLFVAMFAATLIAPAAAPISVIVAMAIRDGSADLLLFAPLALVTLPGLYGYFIGFLATLLLGTAMTLLSLRFPVARSLRIWLAVGAVSGALVGLVFRAHGWEVPALAAVAGAASALTYRLIVGPALSGRPPPALASGTCVH